MEEFERDLAKWLKTGMQDVYKEHPEDFPNGFQDVRISCDNETKQDNAGWQVLEAMGYDLQRRRRALPPYSPKMHRVRNTNECAEIDQPSPASCKLELHMRPMPGGNSTAEN